MKPSPDSFQEHDSESVQGMNRACMLGVNHIQSDLILGHESDSVLENRSVNYFNINLWHHINFSHPNYLFAYSLL